MLLSGTVFAQTSPPLAIFAGATNLPLGSKVMDMSSGHSTITGRIHSDSDINVSGTANYFENGIVESVTGVQPAPNFPGKVTLVNCPVVTGAVQAFPVTYQQSDFAPGGSQAAAAQAAGDYYHIVGSTHLTAFMTNGILRTGLYYIEGDLNISQGSLSGQVTLVATGTIIISGTGENWKPYSGCLLAYSTQSLPYHNPAINISSGSSQWTGVLYAPNAGVEISGSGDTINGGALIALGVQLTGSALNLTGIDLSTCGGTPTNQAPVVNAGPDQAVSLHTNTITVQLAGTVTDDGLPVGGKLESSWSFVSGPVAVSFANPTLTNTTVTLNEPGTYVLRLTADDSALTNSDDVIITFNRPDNPPVAYNQSVTNLEEKTAAITLEGSDPDGDPITFFIVTQPSFGTLSGTAPDVLYTPKAGYYGPDSFTFKVNDGFLDSAQATVSITNLHVNHAPIAESQSVTTAEDMATNIVLTGSDADGDALTFAIVNGPTQGTLVGSNSTYIYTPASNYFGPDAFSFIANDGITNSSPGLVSITVTPVDQPPLVNAGPNQFISLPQSTVQLSGTVEYENFPDTVDTVQWTQLSGPGIAAFSDSSNEVTGVSFSQSGIYELQLVASDSYLSGTNTVQITVNAPPIVNAGPGQTNTLPGTIALNGFASDDGLPTNGTLTVVWSQVSGLGTAVFSNPNQTNTTVSFSKSGVYDLRLTANDGAALTSNDVTVLANSAPVVDAGSDQTITNLQAALNGTAFDDGLPTTNLIVTWSRVSGPGTATFANSNSAATTVTFSQTGVYELELTADDSLAQSSADVTITVDGAPVVGVSGDTIVTLPTTANLTATAMDDGLPVGSTLSYQWTQVSGPGTVTFSDATALATTASFSTNGVYVIQFAASDSLLTSTTNITVIANLAPMVSAGPPQLIAWPQSATLNGTATDDGLPYHTLTTTWSQVSGSGTVTFANSNSPVTTASFSASGVYVLELTAGDGVTNSSATVTITANQAPVVSAGPNQLITWPSNQVSLAGSATDDGLPYGTLTTTWTSVSGPGTVTFGNPAATNTTATFSASGVYVLQLTANDGAASTTSQVTITLNQPPVVNAGSDQTILWPSNQVALNGAAADDGLPSGTLTANWNETSGPGTVTFANPTATNTTATFSAPGLYVLNLSASDESASSSASVTITVDQAPSVSLPAQFIINWPSNQVVLSGTVADEGLPVGAVLSQEWTQTNGPGTISFAPAVQTNVLAGTAISNAVSTIATVSAPGLYNVQLTADDGVGTNQAVATVIANQAPVVSAGSNQVVTLPQAALLNGTASDDGLPIGQLTYSWAQVSGPGVATFANASTNSTSVSFSAPGIYVLQLSANDSAATGTAQVTIRANGAPVAQSQSVTVVEDSSTNIVLQASDVDGDPLSFAIVTQPQNGTLSQGALGQYLYTPAATYFGSDSFTFKANDGYVDSAPATVTITVLAKNHPPTFTAGPNVASLQNAGPQTVVGWASNISPGPADESSQTVHFLVNSDNPGLFSAAPSIDGNGTLTYTSAANANGVTTVTVQAQDNGGTSNGGMDTSAAQTFTITIAGPPVVSVPGPQTVGDALPLVFDTNKLVSVSDPYVGQGTMQLSVSVSNGAVAFGSTNGLSFLSGTNGSSNAVVTGTLSNLNASLLNLTYSSVLHYSGTDTLSLVISDLGNNGTGTALTASNRVSISVFRTNHPPVFVSTPVTNATSQLVRADGTALSVGVTNVFNLGTWSVVQYGPFGEGNSDWVLSNSNTVVNQLNNSDPSIFLGPSTLFRDQVQGSFSTTDGDNDFMGFVFGYQNSSNYYLFDWKQGTETPYGSTGYVGMSVKVITASPNEGADFWGTFPSTPGVHTIYHNSIPFTTGATYQYTLNFQPGDFTIQVNQGSTVLTNIHLFDETYASGQFGFYNYSQGLCKYAGFSDQPLAADSYIYPSLAIDPDGDPVTYSIVAGPTNMTINPTNGLIQWYPYTNSIGNYQVTIEAADNHGGTTLQTFTINVPPPIINKAPFVYGGGDRAFTGITNIITLNGVATDDGLPSNTLFTAWSKVFGPGTVTFGNSNSPVTTAQFSTNGIYVLEFSASDTLDTSASFVTVRVNDICTVQPPSGIVAWWPGSMSGRDEVTGANAFTNAILYGNGEVGPAFSFDGLSSYVDAPAQPSYNVGANGLSLEFWIDPNNFEAGSVLGWSNGVRVERITSSGGYAGDSLRVFLTGTNAGQYLSSPLLWSYTSWTWTHVAVTYDATSGTAALYINGLLSTVNNVGTNLLSTAGDFYLGHVPGSTNYFPGLLDEVSIYNRALTGEEIYDIFAAGSVGKCPYDNDQPPMVYAGPDLFVTGVPGVATLAGQVQIRDNDGQPTNAPLDIQWSKLTGPGTVTFGSSNTAVTSATFSTNGVYVLKLTADDGESQSSDVVEVRVEALCTVNDPQGLTAWWPANGSDFEALHGYPAIMNGSAGYTNGYVGAAFNFDGVDDSIDFPAQTNYNIGISPAGFSIEWWMNPVSTQNGGVMGWANGVRLERFSSGSSGGDSLHCYIGGTGTGQYIDALRVCSGLSSNWTHFVLTYDHLLGAACMYVNGTLFVSNYVGTNVMSTAGDFYMGQVPGSTGFYNGRLDEVSLYMRPLNTEEVYSLFASGSTGMCPNNGNTGPIVYAGPDLFLTNVPGTATLNGEATDDGLPAQSTLHFQWSKFAGPGTVTFANSTSAVTTATFSTNGIYVLQLTADDGEMQASDLVEVRVETLCNATDPAGLVAWWPANGDDVEVINGYDDSLLYNGMVYTNGEVAAAFNFNGVNNYVWLPAHTNYDVGTSTNGFTIEFWMSENSAETGGVLGWVNGVRLERTYGGSASGDTLRFDVCGTGANQSVSSTRVFTSSSLWNLWYHIALTYDRTTGDAKIYINGVLNAQANVGTNIMTTASDFYLGQVPGTPSIFSGRLDEISLYARPLNAQEIYSLFTSGSTGKCPEDGNQPPVVSAGPDLFVTGLPGVATLNGQATDDGLPVGSTLQTGWSLVSGPGTVTFANSNSPVTTATFSTNGIYVLQLTANDSEYQVSDLVEVRVDTICVAQDPAGLAAWWPANNTPTEVLSGQNAVPVNGLTYTNGVVAQAFQFTGGNYIIAPASSNYDVGSSTNGFTIELWINAAYSGYGQALLSWNNTSEGGTNTGVSLTQGGGKPVWTIVDTSGVAHAVNASALQYFINGSWVHLALTYNRSTGMAEEYANGILAVSQNIGSFQPQTSYDLMLGAVPGVAAFTGKLDEISLYRRPLTPAEIYSIYQSGSIGKCPENANQPPTVSAGPDLSLASTNVVANLNGFVFDDGLPVGGLLQSQWSVVDGPGVVTFGNTNSPTTTAIFSTNGIYTLQLAANDSEQQSTSIAQVRVGAPCGVTGISGQVAWWTGNSNAVDKITGIPALLVNGASYAQGKVGAAFQFNGTNDFVLASARSNYDIGASSNGFTVEFWEKAPSSGSPRGAFSWNNGTANGVFLYVSGGSGVFNVGDNAGNGHQFTVGSVFDNTWRHVALTYDRVAGQAKVYLNGALASTQTVGSFQPQTSFDLQLGGVYTLATLIGELDEFSLYTRPLTQTEIQSIYNAGALGKCATPNNKPPVLTAGTNQTITFPTNTVTLNGIVGDDGLPSGTLNVAWTYVSGPSTVFFSSTNTPVTTVTFTNIGTYTFNLYASDGQLSTNANVIVNVLPDTRPRPVVSITSPANGSLVAVPTNGTANLTLTAAASSADGVITNVEFYLSGADVGSSTTAPYTLNLPSVPTGTYSITAVAMDNDGLNTTSAPVTATIFVDQGPPEVDIFTPADSTIVTAPTNIISIASSDILQSWQLRYRLAPPATGNDIPTDNNGWTTLASGTTSVVSNTLAVFDPTMLLNGIYQVQVVATDLEDRTAYSEATTLKVDRNLKIGNFSISFNDLTVPVAGIPIQITRTYDSRDHRTNDFGVGWSIGVRNVYLQKNRSIGTSWYEDSTGGTLPYYNIDSVNERDITVTLANGQEYKFTATMSPSNQFGATIDSGTVIYQPTPDTYATLQSVEGDDVIVNSPNGVPGTVDLFDAATGDNFNPTLFKMTTEEGETYIIDEIAGLQSMSDRNGNTLLISTNGVIWTNTVTGGASTGVSFVRDAQGRISQIIDPAGNALNYTYGTNGSLATFTDRNTNTTTFAYTNAAFPNYLTGITDPRGIQAIRTIYDDSGRMIEQIDGAGNVIQYTHDLPNNAEVVQDRLGYITLHEYDGDGNITNTTDPLGNVTTYTFDANGNLLQKVDALGNTNSYTYDSKGNKLSETDPLGFRTYCTYGPMRELTSFTTPRGFTSTNTYDPDTGNLTQEQDSLGNVTSYSYDGQGNILTRIDPLGNIVSNRYDNLGHMTTKATIDSVGGLLNTTTFTYDTNGNQLSKSIRRTTGGSSELLTTSYVYDNQNRLVATIHPDGSANSTIYALGLNKPAIEIDALGRQTLHSYDALGNLTNTIYADNSSESWSYDADNRKIGMIDRGGRLTSYGYDPLARMTNTVFANGATSATVYDAIGRLIATQDERGNITSYAYDPSCGCSERQSYVTNGLGQVTHWTYDEDANEATMTDALGRTTTYSYDALDRQTNVRYPDGSFSITTYDAIGRRIAQTDQSTNTTWFTFDALSRLIAVTNMFGKFTTYSYDEAGDFVSQTDANNHKTAFEYDLMGRQIKRILPLGQVESYQYDLAGNMTNQTDFNGYSTGYQYDPLNRLRSKTPDAFFAAPTVTFTYTATGQRATMSDAGGMTVYQYNSRDWLTNKTWTPAGQAFGISLNYAYDSHGDITEIQSSTSGGATVSYGYDALNRLSDVNDAHVGCCAEYGYDAVGNLQSQSYPNGISTTYQYDLLNRLTNLTTVNGQSALVAKYDYTVAPTGQRLTTAENVVVTNTIHTINRLYTYDATYRLVNESLSATIPVSLPPTASISYTLDVVGNRLSRNSTLSPLLSTTSTYDANDRLTSDTYDANGNTIVGHVTTGSPAVSDTYDFEDHLIQRQTTLNSQPTTINIVYDGDGNRVAKTVGGVTTLFLVDDRNPSGYAQVLEELTSLNSQPPTLNRAYTYGADLLSQRLLSTSNSLPATYFYGCDGHGNVRYLTDTNGVATDTYDYDAFGIVIAKSGTTPNNFLYCGQQYDADLGLYYNRARYLDADAGRFWTRDAFEGAKFEPVSLHKYLYAHAEPVGMQDHNGYSVDHTDFILDGILVHRDIGKHFVSQKPNRLANYYPIGGILNRADKNDDMSDDWVLSIGDLGLKPDLVDLDTREVWEIKTTRGVEEAEIELAFYLELLNGSRRAGSKPWTPGVYYTPPTSAVGLLRRVDVYEQDAGIITYDPMITNDELVYSVGFALAYRISAMMAEYLNASMQTATATAVARGGL